MSILHIYRASAGSGKTFTLTRNFLEKALADPQRFSRIAALTFTNKATAEMKARIFGTLGKLVDGAETEHTEYLCTKLGLTKALLTERADWLRRYVLAEYRDFTVTTLDKFFQRILRSFAREINVDSGFEPELDYGRVMEEIVTSLTEELQPDMPLTGWVTDYLEDKLEEGKSRDFRSAIKGLGMKIFDEDFRAIAHELEKIEDTYTVLGNFRKKLDEGMRAIENQLATEAQKAVDIMERHDLHPTEFTGGSRSAFRYFSDWADGIVSEPKDSFRKLAGCDVDKWYAKSAPTEKKEAIESAYHNGLHEVVLAVLRIYDENEKLYESYRAASKNLFVFGIFSELVKKLENYRSENNVLLLADAVDLLRNLTRLDDASFVYEKTGTRYDTYLLDEFQDTSGFQWDCTVPLVHNALSEGNESLLVGDPKQSIYRWRGGDRELINSKVPEQFPNHEIHRLDTNFRSRKNVIRFNNTVFSLLPKLIFAEMESEFGDQTGVKHKLDLLRQTYSDVVQKWAGKKEGGYVKVRFFEKDELTETEEDFAADEALTDTIKQLQDRGFKPKDIVILVRKNADAKRAADVIQSYKWNNPESPYTFDIISDEASYLENSAAVSLMVHVAQFLISPANAVNNAGLLLEWNRINPQSVSQDVLLAECQNPEKVRKLLPQAFSDKERELAMMAPGPLFDSLVYIFSLDRQEEDYSYLAAFRDLVTSFAGGKDADLASFLNHWHEKGKQTSIKAPDDAEAIRIMTFHKCKGLEFEAVVIPYFSEKTDHASFHSVPLWVRSDVEPFSDLPYFPVNYGKALMNTIFADSYFNERLEVVSDALNIAYVAFTRAKSELHIFAEKPKLNSKASPVDNLGHLLYFLAENQQAYPEGENFAHIYPDKKEDEDFYLEFGITGQRETEPERIATEVNRFSLTTYPNTAGGKRLQLKKRENPAHYSPERRKGIRLHAMLEKLTHYDDLLPLLNHLEAAGELSPEEKTETMAGMEALLADADVRNLFSPKAEIKTETALITTDRGLRIPDRIAALDGKVYVGDFKTGKENAAHIKQVQEYLQLIREMGYPNVLGILLYTSTGKTVKINP